MFCADVSRDDVSFVVSFYMVYFRNFCEVYSVETGKLHYRHSNQN